MYIAIEVDVWILICSNVVEIVWAYTADGHYLCVSRIYCIHDIICTLKLGGKFEDSSRWGKVLMLYTKCFFHFCSSIFGGEAVPKGIHD